MDAATWYASRAAGLLSYGLLWASVVWGITVTAKPFTRRISRAAILDWHRILTVTAFTFAVIHAVVLLLDKEAKLGIADLVIPFRAAERPLATAMGVVALELGLAVGLSIKIRKVIGQRAWRGLHYLSYPVYFLALLHFIAIGTDAKNPVVFGLALASGLFVVFATGFRVAYRAAPEDRLAPDARRPAPRNQEPEGGAQLDPALAARLEAVRSARAARNGA